MAPCRGSRPRRSAASAKALIGAVIRRLNRKPARPITTRQAASRSRTRNCQALGKGSRGEDTTSQRPSGIWAPAVKSPISGMRSKARKPPASPNMSGPGPGP